MKATGRGKMKETKCSNTKFQLSRRTKIYSTITVNCGTWGTQHQNRFSRFHYQPQPLSPFRNSLRDQLRSKVLTVCEGCQPHLEESYTVCSRTATGDAWPSGILASLPLPAEERGRWHQHPYGFKLTWETRRDISNVCF